MAPEQREAGPLGPPTDVWGLAATVHAALTGKPWRAGATARAGEAAPVRAGETARRDAAPSRAGETARRDAAPSRAGETARRDAAPLPRRTPAALRDVVVAGLDPDAASRPSARAFAEALEPLVAALPRRLTLGRRS